MIISYEKDVNNDNVKSSEWLAPIQCAADSMINQWVAVDFVLLSNSKHWHAKITSIQVVFFFK